MRAQRGGAASFGVSMLLLGSALVWPVGGQAQDSARNLSVDTSEDTSSAGIDITPPDVPAAKVTINPSDLAPGDAARRILSRIVADPGTVLKAYAPLGRGGATPAASPVIQSAVRPSRAAPPPDPGVPAVLRASLSASPSPKMPWGPERPKPEPAPSATAMASPEPAAASRATSLGPAPNVVAIPPAAPPSPGPASSAPSPDARPVTESMPPRPAQTLPSAPGTTPQSPTVAPGTADEVAHPRSSGEEASGTLDAAALHKALEAFVGPEAARALGQGSAQADLRRKDREAVSAVYAARNFAPFWIENGKFNAKGRAALARIDHASEDGLDLRAFPISVPRGGDADTLAAAELALTDAAVAYANQASGGRVDPSRLAPLIGAKPDVADPARVLGSLANAEDAGEALRAFNPPQKGYALLRDKLSELRQNSDVAGHNPIPYGPTLRPGMRDARVPLIRARFGLDLPSDEADRTGLVYDTQVAAAVADFQRAHHLPASGVLTIRTIAALSGGNPRRLEDEILANMERWRWLPRDMGENHIEVNIPDYSLRVMHGDTVFHHARVVVGQPDKPTPVFSDTMQFIIVNPYWNVPLSIVKKEMLPKFAADPDYFANHGYEVVERNGITYVRQPPGDSNALGRIKFMFPNKYSVYLHDTNARSLFGSERRALSHGCVRVEQPFKLAEVVLGRDSGWTEGRVKKMVGGDERTINLPHPLPLHIVYFTAFVDETGTLRLRDDVYGYSAKLKAALGLEG